jgi:hypothetical protein
VSFFSTQSLSYSLVSHCDSNLTYNTIFSLAIACTIHKQNSLKQTCIWQLLIPSLLFFIVLHQIKNVFYRHLCITNHKFLLILEQYYSNVENVAFTKMVLNCISFAKFVSVYSIHADFIVINSVIFCCFCVSFDVITFIYLIFIKWETVLDCHTLNVRRLLWLFLASKLVVCAVVNELLK